MFSRAYKLLLYIRSSGQPREKTLKSIPFSNKGSLECEDGMGKSLRVVALKIFSLLAYSTCSSQSAVFATTASRKVTCSFWHLYLILLKVWSSTRFICTSLMHQYYNFTRNNLPFANLIFYFM